jgi:hypothetical protein
VNEYLTSKAVERQTNLSGSYLRKLVRDGVVRPARDSSGRFLYTSDDVVAIWSYQSKRSTARHG